MLAFIYRSGALLTTPTIADELVDLLRSYGLQDIIYWDQKPESLLAAQPEYDGGDMIFVDAEHTLGNMAVRRLTLNSVRIPSNFVVWDGPSMATIVAARMKTAEFMQLLQKEVECGGSLTSVFHALADENSIKSYTMQQFSDASSMRIGGSFSRSGIGRHYRKNATALGAKKLRDEIRMYQSLPQTLRSHYPRLLFCEDNAETGVVMGTQYKDYPNLRDLLLNMEITVDEAVRLLQQVLEFEFCEAFLGHKQPVPEDYLHDYHFGRVWRRIAISKDLDPSFGALVGPPWLEINGRRLPNVPAMLLRLERDQNVVAQLLPDSVSPFIHGDLHLENILCDVAGSRFWFVDPRGYPVCDIYYDLGKLAHSYNSCYDLLHEGRHTADFSVSDDGQIAEINYEFLPRRLVERYADLNSRMNEAVHELLERYGEDKAKIDLRIRFNEAMHFCSDMPFHINTNAKPFIAQPIYAIGARLLSEVLAMLGIDLDECVGMQDEALARLATMGEKPWRFEG